ncbi:hard-surface inducible [Fusarium phyllophilum]|uniref:Hard-surface inducible n=1 Tax=Fusarium phyllophilum TaxID=47803 RepID=A0A8H5MRJ3_9HYPO|nr:hard-surface inducible [Fusarium phyllophilum]
MGLGQTSLVTKIHFIISLHRYSHLTEVSITFYDYEGLELDGYKHKPSEIGVWLGIEGKMGLGEAQADVEDLETLAKQRSLIIGENDEEIIGLENIIQVRITAFLKLQEEMDEKAKELRTHMHEGHVAPTPTAAPESKLRFKYNIRRESSSCNKNVFFDLKGAGGQNLPVHAISVTLDGSYKWDSNHTWEILSVPGFNTRVVIKIAGNSFVLFSAGRQGQTIEWRDGRECHDSTQVRFRNAKDGTYLDLLSSNTANGTAFLTYNGHGGANQAFKLWKH